MDSRAKAKPEYKLKGPVRTSAHVFFSPNNVAIGSDLCDIIGTHASTETLGRLSSASKGSKYCFERSLNLRHDAHIILQVMMNHPEEVPHVLQQAEKLYGRENVWELLVEQAPGTEEHCNGHWNAISPICFAAWSGNFYQYLYELVPMPENEDAELEQGKLYVNLQSLGKGYSLNYTVVDPHGNTVKNFICEEDLGISLAQYIDQNTGALDLEKLRGCLADIMKIAYERGEINDANPKNSKIADTYLLNLFYQYIPEEKRHIANRELEKLLDSFWRSPVFEFASMYRNFEMKYGHWIGSFGCTRNQEYEIKNAWRDLGRQFRCLSWHAIRVFCSEIPWVDAEFDFNQMQAPQGEPNLYMENDAGQQSAVQLRSCLGQLGRNFGIYFDEKAWAEESCMYGPVSALHRSNYAAICRYANTLLTQLNAFVAWQKLEDKTYREEQKHNMSLARK